MSRLSIIVPIYNGEKHLKKCIHSILAQSYTDFELILVDDGSTDGSLGICREYEAQDSRVVVFHKENAGLVAARKSGISVSRGEYIGFIDCDDFIDPNMYLDLMSAAERDGSDIVVGGIIIDKNGQTKNAYNMLADGLYNREKIESVILPSMLAHSGFLRFGVIPGVVVKVFRRGLLERAIERVDDEIRMGEDTAITSYAVSLASSITIISSCAYHYVQWQDSMIRGFNLGRFDNLRILYSCLLGVEDGSYQKSLNLYMSFLLFNTVNECITKSGYDRKKLRSALKSILGDGMSRRVLLNADTSFLGFKDKIKLLLMRYSMVGALIKILEK